MDGSPDVIKEARIARAFCFEGDDTPPPVFDT
jgi:hypothetical protein